MWQDVPGHGDECREWATASKTQREKTARGEWRQGGPGRAVAGGRWAGKPLVSIWKDTWGGGRVILPCAAPPRGVRPAVRPCQKGGTGGEAGSPGGGYPLRTLQSERKGQQSREKALACVPGEPVQGWRPRPPQRFPRGPSNGDSFSVVCVSGHQTVFRVLIVTATVWDFPIKIDRTLTSKRDSDIKETSKGPSQSN